MTRAASPLGLQANRDGSILEMAILGRLHELLSVLNLLPINPSEVLLKDAEVYLVHVAIMVEIGLAGICRARDPRTGDTSHKDDQIVRVHIAIPIQIRTNHTRIIDGENC